MSNYPGALSGGFVSHRFVSLKPDQPDLSVVNPTNWNQAHIIGSGAIQSGALGASMVNSGNVSANAIISGSVASGAVVYGTLASGAVSSGAHASNSVVSGNIAALSVTSGAIASGATSWNLFGPSKPFVTVTPNGPTDGGDYGPNTPGTTTKGLQEAINYIEGLTGGGTVLIDVKMFTSSFAGTESVTVNKSNVAIVSTASMTATITQKGFNLTLSNGSGSQYNDLIQGLVLESVTLTSGSSNIVQAIFRDNLILGQVTSGGSSNITGIVFEHCVFSLTDTDPFSFGAPVNDFTLTDCGIDITCSTNNETIHIFYQNCLSLGLHLNNLGIQQDGAATNVIIEYIHVAANLQTSGTGSTIINAVNLDTTSHLASVTVYGLVIPACGGTANWGMCVQFDNLRKEIHTSTETFYCFNIANTSWISTDPQIAYFKGAIAGAGGPGGGVPTLGTLPAVALWGPKVARTALTALYVGGFNRGQISDAFPATGSYFKNPYTLPLELTITGVGTGISAYGFKDENADTQAVTMTVTVGQKFILEPNMSIQFTYTGTPTWAERTLLVG